MLRHYPELHDADRRRERVRALAARGRARGVVIELAPGIHRLGHGAGGRVSAFLVEDGGELSLVDTLFESDARLVLEAIRGVGKSVAVEADRGHARPPLAPRRPRGAEAGKRRDDLRPCLGGRHRQRRPPRAACHPAAEAVPEADPVPARAAVEPAETRPLPGGRRARRRGHLRPAAGAVVSGHSPGHLAFWWPERSFLIAGDAIATWPSLCAGWTAFTLNRTQHAVSLRRMAALDARIVGVGHGEPITEDAADRVHALATRPVP